MMLAQLFGSLASVLIIKTIIDFDMVNLWNDFSLFLSRSRSWEPFRLRIYIASLVKWLINRQGEGFCSRNKAHSSELCSPANECWCNDLFVLRLWNMKCEVKRRWTNSLRNSSKCVRCVMFVSDVSLRGFRALFVHWIDVQTVSFPFGLASFTNRCKSIIVLFKRFQFDAFVLLQTNRNNVRSNTDTRYLKRRNLVAHFNTKLVKFNADCDVCSCVLSKQICLRRSSNSFVGDASTKNETLNQQNRFPFNNIFSPNTLSYLFRNYSRYRRFFPVEQ